MWVNKIIPVDNVDNFVDIPYSKPLLVVFMWISF